MLYERFFSHSMFRISFFPQTPIDCYITALDSQGSIQVNTSLCHSGSGWIRGQYFPIAFPIMGNGRAASS